MNERAGRDSEGEKEGRPRVNGSSRDTREQNQDEGGPSGGWTWGSSWSGGKQWDEAKRSWSQHGWQSERGGSSSWSWRGSSWYGNADESSREPAATAPIIPGVSRPIGQSAAVPLQAAVSTIPVRPKLQLLLSETGESDEAELVIQAPLQLEVPSTTSLGELRSIVKQMLMEAELEPLQPLEELMLGVCGRVIIAEEAKPLLTLQPGSLVSFVENPARALEATRLGPCIDTALMEDRAKAQAASHKFFKTRPCFSFNKGFCAFGNSCTFAHGPQELRPSVAMDDATTS